MTITTRQTTADGVVNKNSPLSNAEVDGNFIDLKQNKYEAGDSPSFADVSAESVSFDTSNTVLPTTAGTMVWSQDTETVSLVLEGGVELPLGEKCLILAKADEAISKGDVVYASSAIGNSGKIGVSKYIANNTIPSRMVIGIAAADIASGDFGYVTAFGSVRELDTTGTAVSETWTSGTILYASPTTAGKFTNVRPVAPNQDIAIAFVINAHANAGVLFVRAFELGQTIGDLHDVYTNGGVTNGDLLQYNSANSRWEPVDGSTSNITEGTNLYYTDTRVNAAIDARVNKAFVDALGVTAANVPWTGVTGKPTTFPPDAHTHVISDVTGLQTALDLKVAIADIQDVLTSNNTNKPLSANQGRILKSAIDNINAILTSDDTTLDELQEIVDFIKQNREDLDALGISNIAGLQTALDGKVDKITGKGLSTEDYTTGEKSKLAGIESGAQVNVATNLSLGTRTTTAVPVNSSTGTNVSLPAATTSLAGVMTSADKTKLDGIAAGAQVNVATNLGSSGTGGTRTITSSTGTNTSITYTAADVGAPSTTGTGASGTWGINITGNAATATKLATARTISLAGDVTGSTSFDGSGNVSITAAVADDSHNHVISNVDGLQTALDGKAAASHTHTASDITSGDITPRIPWANATPQPFGTYVGIGAGSDTVIASGEALTQYEATFTGNNRDTETLYLLSDQGMFFRVGVQNGWASGINAMSVANSGTVTFSNTITGSVSGNAGTATTLQTTRTINGTNFNGSANITTANWGTARTITVGATGKSVNGSGNVSWSLAEIGAPSTTGGGASGTWGINITGNAATATSAGTADNIDNRAYLNIDSGNAIAQDSYQYNGGGYVTGVSLFGQSDGAMHSATYSTAWVHQIYGDFRTGQIALRGKNNGTWQAWRTVLDSGNYNSYSPTKTGTGASGTWGINITGNAATVSNGVYTTGDQTISGIKTFQNSTPSTGTAARHLELFSPEGAATDEVSLMFHQSNRWYHQIRSSGNGFQFTQGNTSSRVAITANQLYGTIFYDTNNTGYYVDPASAGTSANFAGAITSSGQLTVGPGSFAINSDANITVREVNAFAGIDLKSTRTTGNTGGIRSYNSSNTVVNQLLLRVDGRVSINNSGGLMVNESTVIDGSRNITANQLYSTIFYDSNDTGYYVDPASTSQSAVRVRGGTLHGPNTTWGAYLLVGGDGRSGYINNTTTASVCATNGNLHLDAASGYDTLINFYDGSNVKFGDGNNSDVIIFDSSGNGTFNGNVIGSSSVRAPIFYDSLNTAYYVDPNGTSQTNRINTVTACAGGNFNAAQGVLQCKGDLTMNRGAWVRWANDGAGTGEYIYSKADSPYDVTIHSGSYDALQCPNTGQVRINYLGSQRFVTTSAGVSITGSLTASDNVTAYSDIKLKDNIETIPDAINKVKQVRGVTYTRKDLEDKQTRYSGVIAQEVEAVLPEVVGTNEEGTKHVAYGNMVGLLIEAIKEQQTQIEELTSQINTLKEMIK